jgi:hypothetical protein
MKPLGMGTESQFNTDIGAKNEINLRFIGVFTTRLFFFSLCFILLYSSTLIPVYYFSRSYTLLFTTSIICCFLVILIWEFINSRIIIRRSIDYNKKYIDIFRSLPNIEFLSYKVASIDFSKGTISVNNYESKFCVIPFNCCISIVSVRISQRKDYATRGIHNVLLLYTNKANFSNLNTKFNIFFKTLYEMSIV